MKEVFTTYHECEPGRPGRIKIFHRNGCGPRPEQCGAGERSSLFVLLLSFVLVFSLFLFYSRGLLLFKTVTMVFSIVKDPDYHSILFDKSLFFFFQGQLTSPSTDIVFTFSPSYRPRGFFLFDQRSVELILCYRFWETLGNLWLQQREKKTS